jgi:predicted nucleic acid-binding protein
MFLRWPSHGRRLDAIPLPTNDVWVASVAARDGATVVTFDDHFRLIHRVGSNVLPG